VSQASRTPRLFYGWWIVIALSLGNFIVYVGVSQGSLGVFNKALVDTFGWSRGAVSMIGTLILLVPGVLAYFIGAICDRYGARIVCTVGILSAVAGFVVASASTSLAQFYTFSVFLAVAEVNLGFVPMQVLVSHWFHARPGLALGIATAGISMGGIVGPLLMTSIIQDHGLRAAFGVCAVGCLVLATPLIVFVVRNRPADMGLRALGEEPSAEAQADEPQQTEPTGMTLREAARTRTFWALIFNSVGIFYAIFAIAQHWVLLLTDLDLSITVAARLLTVYYALGVLSRFFWGPVFDRYDSKVVGLWMSGLMAAMVVLMTLANATPIVPYLYAIIFGFCYGGFIFMRPLLTAEYFGARHVGKILGAASAVVTVLSSVSPAVTGYLFDATGSYRIPFAVTAVVAVGPGHEGRVR